MAVNLYDIANHFANAFRQSEEYINLKRAYAEMSADPVANQLFRQFTNLQMELEQKQMNGQKITQQEMDTFQKITLAAEQNEKIKKLIEADHRVNMLMAELSKVMTKPIEEVYSRFYGG